jgi:hypothetical protein
MKKNIFLVFVFLVGYIYAANAQVTLEKTYNYSTSIVELENLGYKYYLMDVPNEQCRIYNLDHSLFKTINCNVPSNFYLADIKFVSQNLFDNDAGIEILCVFYRYYSSGQYYEYNSKIINDDGSLIASINGAQYNYINQTGENEYKLFSYCFDYSVFPEKVWTNIYGLPGEAVSSSLTSDVENNFIEAFPNPASSNVKVEYSLPENVNDGILYLLDNTGRHIKNFNIDNHTNHLNLNVTDFKSGIYHYFVEYNNIRTASKQLVIR